MNISQNIEYILSETTSWKLYRNKSYCAKIMKACSDKEYNVPGQKGVVYNFFEDAYEKVNPEGYIITGIAGEMWPIGKEALKKYDIAPERITTEPQSVIVTETDTVYAGIMIPLNKQFTLETYYGEKAVLKGNRPGINHNEGDYILVIAKKENDVYVPDFNDSGRIVNGTVFGKMYRPFENTNSDITG